MWSIFSRRSRSVPPLHKAARPGTRDCVFRSGPKIQPYSHRLAERNRYAPCYVGPRRSGQSLPPVPSPQVYAESAEPFGLVILAGSNLLRLHFRQRLPSAGPTHPCEGQYVSAFIQLYVQAPVHRPTSLQPHQDGSLPRPTALPPMPFVSGYSHGCRRRCIQPQTAQAS